MKFTYSQASTTIPCKGSCNSKHELNYLKCEHCHSLPCLVRVKLSVFVIQHTIQSIYRVFKFIVHSNERLNAAMCVWALIHMYTYV